MTIDEAIKELDNYNKLIKPFVSQKVIEAQGLGIEALKLIKLHRRHPQGLSFALLPREDLE